MANSLSKLKDKLEELAGKFATWARKNCLVMNAGKTQLLVTSSGKDLTDFTVMVDGKAILPSNEFELLGVKYDRQFSTAPHDAMVALAARQRASLIARLTHHVPRGHYLKQLAAGLVLGKVGHALPAVTTPRLSTADGGPNKSYKRVQTALNDVARSITGTKRKDQVRVEDLLEAAKIPSVNAMSRLSVATEAWKAFHSRDGVNGGRNPIGEFMFDGDRTIRTTRAGTSGIIPIPLRGHSTMVTSAAKIWNSSAELRMAVLLSEAKSVAKRIAGGVPL
jgi:hypothetical protein